MTIFAVRASGSCYVGKGALIKNGQYVQLGSSTRIEPYALLIPHGAGASIRIGSRVIIGMFSRIACKNEVYIGDDVITGPNVFISDYNHQYKNPSIPIRDQGETDGGAVHIGNDSWIGTGVVICGRVDIGRHCVIGANSVVVDDIPDYCVAVGAPARVIKCFNPETKKWENVMRSN